MTIPPIGSSPLPPSLPDDKKNEVARTENLPPQPATEAAKPAAERVELSPDAQRIRDRQSEITRLQIAERTANAAERDTREIRQIHAKLVQASRDRDSKEVAAQERRLEERLGQLESRKNDARYEDQNLLDGREMKFKVSNREETLRTPDLAKETDEYARQVRNAARDRRETQDDFAQRTRDFVSRAADIRGRLEKDVRDSVAAAVKESSTPRAKDVADAERLIKQAQEASADTERGRSGSVDQISSRAINLLQ